MADDEENFPLGYPKFKQKKGAAEGSNLKPFDVKVGKWYKVTGKILKAALKKVRSDNALRDLAGVNEEDSKPIKLKDRLSTTDI
jgi:hypothetical protein